MERIPERLSPESLARRRKRTKARQSQFLRGPIPADWITSAAKLRGCALAVALAVWFKAGCEGNAKAVRICPELLLRFGVKRLAGYRGLLALERAGLLSVERRRGRCPRVTLNRTTMRGET